MRRIVAEILAEAERAAKQIDVEKLTQQVFAEARIIARWNKKPFHIT